MDESQEINMDEKDSKKDSNTIIEDTTCPIIQEQPVCEENNAIIEAEMDDAQVETGKIGQKRCASVDLWQQVNPKQRKLEESEVSEDCLKEDVQDPNNLEQNHSNETLCVQNAESVGGIDEIIENEESENCSSGQQEIKVYEKNEPNSAKENLENETGKAESTEESYEVVICKNGDFKFTSSIEEEENCPKNKLGDCQSDFVQEHVATTSSTEESSSQNEDIEKREEISSKNEELVKESQEVVICQNIELKSTSSTDGENSSKNKFEDCQSNHVQEHVASTSSKGENTSQNEDVIGGESKEYQITVTCENREPTHASSEQIEERSTESSNNDENTPEYEKSKVNSDLQLIKEALNHELAAVWTATSHKPYVLNPVEEDTPEFNEVSAIFLATRRDRKICLYVEKIERIENPYLLALYLNKKEKMIRNNSSVREEDLFHGTSSGYIDSICRNNFDWRRCGKSRGHRFGRGVSFTPRAAYAYYYGASSLMILTKVLVCKSTTGDGNTMVPPESCDTTTNPPQTVFVKYEDDEFLPQYVVHYGSVRIDDDDDDEDDLW